MDIKTILKRYHFKDTKELDEFLRIMKNNLFKGALEYSKNCYTPSIELSSVTCDYSGKPKPNYTFLKAWIEKNLDGKQFKDIEQRANDRYYKALRKRLQEQNNHDTVSGILTF